jgi:hypothetical protein
MALAIMFRPRMDREPTHHGLLYVPKLACSLLNYLSSYFPQSSRDGGSMSRCK